MKLLASNRIPYEAHHTAMKTPGANAFLETAQLIGVRWLSGPTSEKGRAEGVPTWSLFSAFSKADGSFVIIF